MSPAGTQNSTFLGPIYPIVNITAKNREPLAFVKLLLKSNVRLIQIRAKDEKHERILAIVKSVIELRDNNFRAGGNYCAIIVNDSPEICLETLADGVHLGQSDADPIEARAKLGKDSIIGFSTHNLEQLRLACAKPLDYLAFGPIFQTTTKLNSDPATGIELLKEAAKIANRPLVAIGGITLENAYEIFHSGIRTVALISDLENSSDLLERINGYREIAGAALAQQP